jgi:hypothetical protein
VFARVIAVFGRLFVLFGRVIVVFGRFVRVLAGVPALRGLVDAQRACLP